MTYTSRHNMVGIVLLERHLDRLCASAAYFGPERFFPPDQEMLRAALEEECAEITEPSMVCACI